MRRRVSDLKIAVAILILASIFLSISTGQKAVNNFARNLNSFFDSEQPDALTRQTPSSTLLLIKTPLRNTDTTDTDTTDTDPSCPLLYLPNLVYMRDREAQHDAEMNNITTNIKRTRRIPRTIHFLIPSRCIPSSIAKIHEEAWKNEPKLHDHTILYHDQLELDKYMTSDQHKEAFPSIEFAYMCAKDAKAKLDIARLLILWDLGGIVVDMDVIPGPAFLNANVNVNVNTSAPNNATWNIGTSSGNGTIVDYDDESLMEVDRDWNANPRFLASEPHHPTIFVAIQKFLTSTIQLPNDENNNYNYAKHRGMFYNGFDPTFYHGSNEGSDVKNYRVHKDGFMKSKIVQIRADADHKGNNATQDVLFQTINVTDIERLALELKVDNEEVKDSGLGKDGQTQTQCRLVESKLRDHSRQTNIKSLIHIAGAKNETEREKETCPEGQIWIPSTFDPNSIVQGHKIPKIIHMTSKSKCFTQRYANNIEKWRFPHHSLFIHDDAAVDMLFQQFDWPEFPLLREILSCIPSGAGKADLWRYLMLWEYGGIYTDIDNTPGAPLLNGTIIEAHMDSFFVQERGGFPSQYFLAASPHHPVMFFMVQHTIARLLQTTTSIRDQYVPFVTGPGATRHAVLLSIGNAYPTKGEYAGVNGRNVTIVGTRKTSGQFVGRKFSGAAQDIGKMNMTHYSKKNQIPAPSHSCFMEIYKNSKAAS